MTIFHPLFCGNRGFPWRALTWNITLAELVRLPMMMVFLMAGRAISDIYTMELGAGGRGRGKEVNHAKVRQMAPLLKISSEDTIILL